MGSIQIDIKHTELSITLSDDRPIRKMREYVESITLVAVMIETVSQYEPSTDGLVFYLDL